MRPIDETQRQAKQPGWYPDPWAPGHMRWWDGAAWSPHATPVRAQTDGFAVASIVLGVIGGSLLAIIFGLVARGRIKRSGGLKEGKGLATAGIVLGSLWLAVIGTLVVLGVAGVFDDKNADDYSGREKQVAQVVDRFEDVADDDDGGTVICTELLTAGYERDVSLGAQKPCSQVFQAEDGKYEAHIDVKSIVLDGPRATVEADEGDTHETWTLVEDPPGTWRIDSIDSK